jgi:hypothetical protein
MAIIILREGHQLAPDGKHNYDDHHIYIILGLEPLSARFLETLRAQQGWACVLEIYLIHFLFTKFDKKKIPTHHKFVLKVHTQNKFWPINLMLIWTNLKKWSSGK